MLNTCDFDGNLNLFICCLVVIFFSRFDFNDNKELTNHNTYENGSKENFFERPILCDPPYDVIARYPAVISCCKSPLGGVTHSKLPLQLHSHTWTRFITGREF